MSDFFKEGGITDSLSLSDLSEVDHNELEQILQSASELDKKYHVGDLEGKQAQKEGLNKKPPITKKGSINNWEKDKSETYLLSSSRLFKESTGPIGYGLWEDGEIPRTLEKHSKNSADWLGLKDSPDKPHSIDDYMERKIRLASNGEDLLNSLQREEELKHLKVKTKEKIEPSSELPVSVPTMTSSTAASSRNKNKGILMNELFGETKLSSEETAIKIGLSPTVVDDSEKKSFEYKPSVTTTRRTEKRQETTSASNPLSSGIDGDFDWLLETKSSLPKEIRRQNISDSSRPKTAALPLASTPSMSPSYASKKDTMKNKIPEWLDDIVRESSQQKKETFAEEDDSKKLPDWLGGTSSVSQEQHQPQLPQVVQPAVSHQAESVLPLSQVSEEVNEVGSNIISKLASVQTELVVAMSKRTENLQVYMQELLNEAERVVSTPNVVIQNNTPANLEKSHKNSTKNIEENADMNDMKQTLEELKFKDDLIHDLEIKVNRLELQNEHFEMKIQNQTTTHEMEVDSLKKRHGFEISAWETRLERLKKSFDEATLEYEEKITRLKENEIHLIAEHKNRIAKLEEECLADLTKLGEFHRLAIEQAASFTIPATANITQMIRLPLRGGQRPKDEVELSEREAALLQKERNIELLKATLEAQRSELEEALEIEKIQREEREREMRRQTTEIRLREEARNSEAKREREQLDSLALQIKIMRDEALKEQGEVAKEKLELAAERARLEATYSLQGRNEGSIPPLDIIQARAEVEAAIETAKHAKEAAEMERRRQAEMRQSVEQITWEQKEMDLRLENRERHVSDMLKSAEKLRNEGLSAIEEAKAMKEEMETQQREMKEQLKQIETKERVLAKERLEIAKEKIELDRRKAQLELILPELNPEEELTLQPSKAFVDPKAVIMRLKAEKELESFITTRK